MPLGLGHQSASEFGLVPKLLTAVPVAALCVTGVLHATNRSPSTPVAAVTTPSATASAQARAEAAQAQLVQLPALKVAGAEQSPASVWSPSVGTGLKVASAASAWSDIPSVAQVAYQRAASVINSASTACHLDWSLLAAVGKIESNHGRSGGSTLSGVGVASPAIIGPALTGVGATALVADTDSGNLDGDAAVDHAIGPMQFLPATWSTVGVDGDGDGVRNPQDIDDAALAAAVYLCAGGDDLATSVGQSAALLRYNRSATYADSVLAAAGTYRTGFTATAYVPTYDTGLSLRAVAPLPNVGTDGAASAADSAAVSSKKKSMRDAAASSETTGSSLASAGKGGHVSPGTAVAPTPTTDPKPGTTPSTEPSTDPTTDPTTEPSTGPSTGPTPSVEPTPTPEPSTEPAPVAATKAELTTLCTSGVTEAFPGASATDAAVAACHDALDGKTLAAAKDALAGVLKGLPAKIAGLPAYVPQGM